MSHPLTGSLTDASAVVYAFAGLVAIVFAAELSARLSNLAAIPTVGSSSWVGSWWYAFKFFTNGMEIIEEGYEKHRPLPFKVSTPGGWMVFLGSREHVEELRRAPDDVLSFSESAKEGLQMVYTMGAELLRNPYHVPIIRSRLARNTESLYPEIRDEIVTAFNEILDLTGNEWKAVPANDNIRKVVCRASNRAFVGLPLCRESDWIDLNVRYTLDVFLGGSKIRPFPNLLKPLAVQLLTNIPSSKRLGRKLLGPIIEERLKYLNEDQNQWADKPDDLLLWLMEEAEGPELTVEYLTNRMLAINFAAIHTSSDSFTHALFYLAANPQYIQPLREEVENIVDKNGWTKTALGNMRKIDSFLRECQRIEGVHGSSLSRKALKNFTFSDGTFIPEGTAVFVATHSMHRDDAFYENARAFKPFRFVNSREGSDEGGKYQYASPALEYLPFGYGRHACPGRFFAATELKTMLAHVVVTYDIKLDDNAPRPQPFRFMIANLPDPRAKVMFRRRVD